MRQSVQAPKVDSWGLKIYSPQTSLTLHNDIVLNLVSKEIFFQNNPIQINIRNSWRSCFHWYWQDALRRLSLI